MKIIDAIKERKSVRVFKEEDVLDQDLKEIFELATKAPSAYNGQQTSIVYTRNKEKIKEIAKLCGGQIQVENANVFILIFTDFYRASKVLEKKGFELTDNKNMLYGIGAVDAGIMANTINMAAINYGYGCTIIGGVSHSPKEIAKIFDLPEHTNIVVGMTLGVPVDNMKGINTKPKLPSNVKVMDGGILMWPFEKVK